jgi:hypothetical protein
MYIFKAKTHKTQRWGVRTKVHVSVRIHFLCIDAFLAHFVDRI